MRTKLVRLWLLAVAIGLGAGFAIGCGSDGPSNPGPAGPAILSSAWGGIWEIRFRFRDCTTDEIFMEVTVVDSFCAGGNAETELGLSDFGFIQCPDVSVASSGNSVSASCAVSLMDGMCSFTQSFTVNGTANSNGTLTGNGQIRIAVSPDDPQCGQDQCYNIDVSGDRLSGQQPWCATVHDDPR